jgi:hypothetical protein
MANYCHFQISVHGEQELLARFASYFTDSMEQYPGNERTEVFVRLDDGKFADFDEEIDVRWLCLDKG